MVYDRILLAIGPEDRDSLDSLVGTAIDLAEPSNASVSLLYAFARDDYEETMEQMDIDTTTSGLTADEVAQRHETVQRATDRLSSLGLDHEIRGVSGGTLSEKIVREIDRVEADAAVVGGSRRSPTGKAVFGDLAQQVLLDAPVPVLYVKPE